MSIQFNPNFGFCAIQKKSNVQTNTLPQLKADTVQFSGKVKEKRESVNVQQGVEFGKKVLGLIDDKKYNLEGLTSLVHENNPDIEVFPSQELSTICRDWQNYEAMYFSHLNENFGYDTRKIFFKVRNNADENEKLLSVINAAHEYTHARQDDNNEDMINFLKTISKNDSTAAQVFVSAAEEMFPFFDNELQAYSCMGAIQKGHPTAKDMGYGQVLPKPAIVGKQDIFNSLNIKNEKEFQTIVNRTFDEVFNTTMPKLQMALPRELFQKIPNLDKPERLKAMIKNYCSMKAKNEYEAYTTESKLAHEITGVDKLSCDIFPIYYKMLSQAF